MSHADHAYYMRRAGEERVHADRAETIEAKTAHQKLVELYLVRAGASVGASDVVAKAVARA